MTIIGLTGMKRAGKDTVAQVLVEDYGFTRLAFADRLKELALEQDPALLTDYGRVRLSDLVGGIGWERAKEQPSVRSYLQDFGIAVREEVDQNYWRDVVMDQIEAAPKTNFVVTDTRFPNEIQAVRDRGGYFVTVTRPGLPDDDQHVSETAWRSVEPDYALFNSGTLGDLQHAVVDMMAVLAPRPRG